MKKLLVVNLMLALVMITTITGYAAAQAPQPQLPPTPPTIPVEAYPTFQAPEESLGESPTLNLPPLKAVLLVGPIDGATGSWTVQEVNNMNLAAAVLQANGVQVLRFYPPGNGYNYNSWADVVAATQGAHFILYRGHGVYWSDYPTPDVGGFYLQHKPQNGSEDGTYFISNDDIRRDLRPAQNAIVMLYGCFTAGSSSSDPGTISLDEAKRRVVMYSQPFFDVGAGGYYADWFGDAFQRFLQNLFSGQTQRQAYENFYDFNGSTVYRTTYPSHPEWALYLDKDNWDYWQYNDAFAGLADRTLENLFVPLTMTITHQNVGMLGDATENNLIVPVMIQSQGQGSFSYTARLENVSGPAQNWVSLETVTPINFGPTTGPNNDILSVILKPNGQPLGTYTANLHITTTSGVLNSDQVIPVQMKLVANVVHSYLPFASLP